MQTPPPIGNSVPKAIPYLTAQAWATAVMSALLLYSVLVIWREGYPTQGGSYILIAAVGWLAWWGRRAGHRWGNILSALYMTVAVLMVLLGVVFALAFRR